MLKKAGIVVAASVAGILAFSPLAFAGDKSHDADKSYSKSDDKDTTKVEEGDVSEGNLENDCAFGNASGDAEQGLFGGSSLLGVASTLTGVVTNAAAQTNTLNCNNVNVTDVVDFNSGNSDTSVQETWIDESFNEGGDEG